MNLEQKGRNLVDVQKMNRALVIRTLQRQQRTTRAEIAKSTGLTKATVTNIVSDLIRWGAVQELGTVTGKGGRRSIEISLKGDNYSIISVWLTRRHFLVGIFDIYGDCLKLKRFPIGLRCPVDELMEHLICQIKRARTMCENRSLLGVAMAIPGPYIKSEKKIAMLTERREWKNISIMPIVKRLEEELDTQVLVEHDSNAATIAEWYFTEKCNTKSSLMCITAGQGVGAGIIENGRLISGSLRNAGEIGHMSVRYDGPRCECGNYGCVEKYCSTLAIQRKVHQNLKKYPDTICTEESSQYDIIRAYGQGDPLAVDVIDEAARYLGYGIVNVINLVSPKKIIIGDELSEAGDRFLGIVKETVKERVFPEIYNHMEISLSTLSNSVLQGVCISLMEEIVQQPEKFMVKMEPEDSKIKSIS